MPRSPISKLKSTQSLKTERSGLTFFELIITNPAILKLWRERGGKLQQTNSWLLSFLPCWKNPASRRSILSCGMHVFSSSGFLLKISPWNSYTVLENPSRAISQPFIAVAYHMNYYTILSRLLLYVILDIKY